MLPPEVLFGALTTAIGALFWALNKAQEQRIQDALEDRDHWREIAIAGTALAKEAIEAPPPSRRAHA